MPLNYPSNPTINQTYVENNIVWTYTGSGWSKSVAGTTSIAIRDEGTTIANGLTSLDFVGSSVEATASGSAVTVTVTGGGSGSGAGLQHTTYTYTGNGSTTTFAATGGITVHTVLAIIGGVTQTPTTDYTVSGSNIIFTSAPPANSQIQLRVLGDVVSSGVAPKISAITITDSSYAAIDDTAVDTSGGYIKLTGTGFASGCLVYFNQTPAASISFISSTELRVGTGALAAGTYVVYVINSDGGVAISVPGVTFSSLPSWQTASGLPDQYDGVLISLSLVATEATSYTITSGSLPPGLSLNTSTGVITGTVAGVTVDTTYTFTVRATDAQLQDSPRTFTVTITVSDSYFRLTTLLLGGEQGNTVIKDSSANNFNITVVGDSRATNFTPYGTGWSAYFDGNDSLYGTTAVVPATSAFTIEMWIYIATTANDVQFFAQYSAGTSGRWIIDYSNTGYSGATDKFVFSVGGVGAVLQASSTSTRNAWHHLVISRNNSNNWAMWVDGTRLATATNSVSLEQRLPVIGHYVNTGVSSGLNGYISNLRVITSDYYDVGNSTITVPTAPLTAVANTSLLTCHTNRFLDGSANNFTITRNGDVAVRSFNPFGIINTGANGSMYFDGNDDYVTAGSYSNFQFGTGDFTVEWWQYISGYNGSGAKIWQYASDGNYFSGGTGADMNSISNLNVYTTGAGSTLSQTVQPYQWNHIVIARASGTLRIFVNGIQTNSIADNSNYTYPGTYPLSIGGGRNGAGTYVNSTTGYITDFKLVKGTAVYTANFTPATSSLTATTNTQLLTLQYRQPHNNHGFQDASSNQFLITRNGNATQGTFSPFSQTGWSNYFSGNQSIYASNAAFAVGTGNFTVELFYNPTAWSGTTQRIFVIGVAGTDALTIQRGSGSNVVEINISASGVTNVINYTWNLNIGQWYHIALVRSGTGTNQTVLYIDGISVATGTSTASISATQLSVGGINWVANYGTQGYISNVRFSSIARTITVPTAPYTSDANTLLLTCQSNRFIDNSSTPKTLTIQNTPSVAAFSPFAPTAAYSPAVHGGSAYFDGTDDRLVGPTSTNLDLDGAINFTIEAWVYPTGYGSTADMSLHIVRKFTGAGGVGYAYGILGGGANQGKIVLYGAGGSINLTSTNQIPLNAWSHISIVKNGTTFTHYLNGLSNGTVTTATTLTASTDNLLIADYGYAEKFKGYISNLRIVKGTAVYTSAFTPPTTPLTAITNTQLLLNFTDAAILDRTGRNVVETVADARTSSVQVKYGNGAMYFDGTGDYLAIPSNPLHNQLYATTRSFTIEFWIYLQAYPGASVAATVISTYGGGGGADGWRIETSPNSPANAIRWVSNGADTACNSTIELNTWIHYAFTYNGTIIKVFKNGVAGSTATTSWTNNTGRMFIGTANAGLAFPITGYIDDLRITNAERYTANFTPPTGPHRLK